MNKCFNTKAGRARLLLTLALPLSPLAPADGISVDKVYYPYVQPLERELEWRAVYIRDKQDALNEQQFQRLGFGRSISDTWFAEGYLIASKNGEEDYAVEAYEVEARWQLTEQGEYSADWGLLFELETEREDDIREFSTALLAVREWGRWVGAGNLFAIYEWGGDIENELETRLALQARYRLSRSLEPALEFYAGEDGQSLGAVLMGTEFLGRRKKIHWEAGALRGLSEKSPDYSFRALVEFEF